jgi:hypothetical protein
MDQFDSNEFQAKHDSKIEVNSKKADFLSFIPGGRHTRKEIPCGSTVMASIRISYLSARCLQPRIARKYCTAQDTTAVIELP